ncbi:MAG: putative PEP-binding protein, partial [Tagaea sp.]
VEPEIMIPLVAMKRELDLMRDHIAKVADEVRAATMAEIGYMLGTMIELPRAALRAGEIAETAEFFSFGTNDLTQTTFGLSRDDAAAFLGAYEAQKILARDPFVSIDPDGVGELVSIGTTRGRAARPDLKVGICGDHGGDPASIRFCEKSGLDYVSCSPYRVPIARLAAAQAAIEAQAGAPAKSARAAGKPTEDRHKRVLISAGRRAAGARVSAGRNFATPMARPGKKKAKPVAKPAKTAKPKKAPPAKKKPAPKKKPPAKKKPAKKGRK